MDKRYQVFVSSTFTDLKEERQKVMQALLKLKYIPSGMELFPATSTDQLEYIKKVIDDCDYYLLLIAARYGSLSADGISFTEQEYQYAKQKGKPIIVLVHANPKEIALGRADTDPELVKRLATFRAEAQTGRVRDTWETADQLPFVVAAAMNNVIEEFPAAGWVRGNQVASTEILTEINDLRKANDALKQELDAAREALSPKVANLAGLDETFCAELYYPENKSIPVLKGRVTWKEVFNSIAAKLTIYPMSYAVRRDITHSLTAMFGEAVGHWAMTEETFLTIQIQLTALGLVDIQPVTNPDRATEQMWSLTPQGKKLLYEVRAVKSAKAE